MSASSMKKSVLDLDEAVLSRDFRADTASVATWGELSPSVLFSVLTASPDCIKLLSTDGTLEYMNKNGQCAMEIDDFGSVQGQVWCDLWPAEARAIIDSSVRRASRGEPSRFEAYCPTAKGTPRWWDVTTTPIRDDSGAVERILSISRDISALKEKEITAQTYASQLEDDLVFKEEMLDMQSTLMREIDHRVRNSLNMIGGLLTIHSQVSRNTEVQAALQDSANRVRTVAQLHELLYRGDRLDKVNAKDYLSALVNYATESAGSRQVRLVSDIDPVELDFRQSTALGMICAEALLNAIRHGMPPGDDGAVRVSFHRDASGVCRLEIENSGGSLPEGFDPASAGGLGLKIVNIYAEQLCGQFQMYNLPEGGVLCTLAFDSQT